MSSPSFDDWQERGWQVLYLDADDRIPVEPNRIPEPGKRELPHDGRGVLTFYGEDGKESWAPPADDIRLVWRDEYKVWNLYIPAESDEDKS